LQIFSVSFLDVLSCALGSVLMLLLLAIQNTPRVEPTPVPEPIPQPASDPVSPQPTSDDEPALVVHLEWDRAEVDIDLWVKDPSGPVGWSNRQSAIGSYLQDSQSEQHGGWEEYHADDPHAGVYEVHAHYYSGARGAVQATLSVTAFRGSAGGEQRLPSKRFTMTKPEYGTGGTPPGRLVLRFQMVQIGDGYRLQEL